jgi:hypothetical protein
LFVDGSTVDFAAVVADRMLVGSVLRTVFVADTRETDYERDARQVPETSFELTG